MISIASLSHQADAPTKALARQALEQLLARPEVGFHQIPSRPQIIRESLAQAQLLRDRYSRMLIFGIGGSSLGAQFLNDVFCQQKFQISFCDNVDPYFLSRLLGHPKEWKQGCFVFISKSGTTIETLAGLQFLHEWIGDSQWTERALVMTEPGENPLSTWASLNKVSKLNLSNDIGGRFSALSHVGMVPAAYLGVDIQALHKGAGWALANQELIVELVAQSLMSLKREEWITNFWSYGTVLRYFGQWMVQLWGESLGKSHGVDGKPAPRTSTPVAAVGATDQHSALQQVMGGAKDKFLVFHRVKKFELDLKFEMEPQFPHLQVLKGKSLGHLLSAEAQATFQAMRKQGHAGLEIEIDDLGPESIGALLMTWKLVVASLGLSLGINPFDQSGVELGKRLALDILRQ
jgi:glucose-6-phosphate isomerase